jgi:hypothetical protein
MTSADIVAMVRLELIVYATKLVEVGVLEEVLSDEKVLSTEEVLSVAEGVCVEEKLSEFVVGGVV